jgi:hypothetical protein
MGASGRRHAAKVIRRFRQWPPKRLASLLRPLPPAETLSAQALGIALLGFEFFDSLTARVPVLPVKILERGCFIPVFRGAALFFRFCRAEIPFELRDAVLEQVSL